MQQQALQQFEWNYDMVQHQQRNFVEQCKEFVELNLVDHLILVPVIFCNDKEEKKNRGGKKK